MSERYGENEHLDSEAVDASPTGARRDEVAVTAHEERAEIGTELHETGRVRVKKHVETYPVEETVPRSVEHADTSERIPATEGDSGEVETLEDGSVSIPVFEEVLVVTKRLVVKERVIVRKRTVIDEYLLQTDLRREHVTVDAEGDVEVAGTTASTDAVGLGADPTPTAVTPTVDPHSDPLSDPIHRDDRV